MWSGVCRLATAPPCAGGLPPRLITISQSEPPGVDKSTPTVEYINEQNTLALGKYNTILTVAEFMDKKALEWYWADEYMGGRAVVDGTNCEDILMNFVVASREGSGDADPNIAHVRFVRPRRRLDISRLSSYGISRGAAHLDKRIACSEEFINMFGGNPLKRVTVDWEAQVAGRPMCGLLPGLGCVYL